MTPPDDAVFKQIDYLASVVGRVEEHMIDPREFGRLEGAVSALKTELDSVKDRQVAIDGKLDQVLERLSEARGGWRLLMLLGGAGASLGAGLTWLISHLHIAPKP